VQCTCPLLTQSGHGLLQCKFPLLPKAERTWTHLDACGAAARDINATPSAQQMAAKEDNPTARNPGRWKIDVLEGSQQEVAHYATPLCVVAVGIGDGSMSAYGPKRTSPYVAFDVAFGGKAGHAF